MLDSTLDLAQAPLGLATAAGVGLLIGVERERSKGIGPDRGSAGIRTFTLISLAGAIAQLAGPAGIAIGGAFVALLAFASYRRTRTTDPGMTTEVAMLVIFLLGILAMRAATLAAGVGVTVALL